jgi:chromosome partitioning protein
MANKLKTIVIANQKGGVGKTTLTAFLAVAAELDGDGPAVLIDADPQASLTEWWNAREAERPHFAPTTLAGLPEKLKALEEAGYRFAFIDTPPSVAEAISFVVKQADFVLVPVKPSPHDLRAVGRTVEIIAEAGKPFAFVVTQAKNNAVLTVQALAALSAHGVVSPSIAHDRVDYAASMTDGRAVQETDPRSRSTAEMKNLWKFVKARMNENQKTRKAKSE